MCEIEIKLNWTIHSNKTFSYCYEHWEGDGLAGPLGRNFYTLSCFALQVKETFGAESNQSLKTCFSILKKLQIIAVNDLLIIQYLLKSLRNP